MGGRRPQEAVVEDLATEDRIELIAGKVRQLRAIVASDLVNPEFDGQTYTILADIHTLTEDYS